MPGRQEERSYLYTERGYPTEGPALGDPERLTDMGNARRLVYQHEIDLRYAGKRWYVWDGCRWALDETGEVERRAKDTIRRLFAEAMRIEDDAERTRLAKFALASEAAGRIRAMIEMARSELPIAISADDFDTDPFLFNCPQSGTLDYEQGSYAAIRAEISSRKALGCLQFGCTT